MVKENFGAVMLLFISFALQLHHLSKQHVQYFSAVSRLVHNGFFLSFLDSFFSPLLHHSLPYIWTQSLVALFSLCAACTGAWLSAGTYTLTTKPNMCSLQLVFAQQKDFFVLECRGSQTELEEQEKKMHTTTTTASTTALLCIVFSHSHFYLLSGCAPTTTWL